MPRRGKLIREAEALPPSRGPAWLKLIPQHRMFVDAYVARRNAAQAYRDAGYTTDDLESRKPDGKGPGAHVRQHAYKLLQRQDIKEAVVEEVKRQLGTDLPIVMAQIKTLAGGKPLVEGKTAKPLAADSVKLLMFLAQQGGLHNIQEHKVEVEVKTDVEKLRELRRLAEQGVIPADMVKGITLTETEYREIEGEG